MAEPRDHGPIFERLIELNREAFDAGRYDTAYHLLAAALHEVEDDAQRLPTVQHIAEEQLAWIDAAHPEYEHSTASAASRGHTSIFAMLARQAHAKLLIAQPERKRVLRPRPDPEHGFP